MTTPKPPDDSGETLFIADFYPRLGAYLARQHERGYDAVAGRARFLLWLATHAAADDSTDDDADGADREAIGGAVGGRPSVTQDPELEAAIIDEFTQAERRMLQARGRESAAEELAAELDPSSSVIFWSPRTRGRDQDL